MVYFRNLAEVDAAFTPMVGVADWTDPAHRPDSVVALQLAALQDGETVLEFGAGCGRFIAQAKVAVRAGFCAAVDAVPGFINTDIPFALQQQGLSVHPQGQPAKQVHLLRANVTDGALPNRLRALPGAPQTFDCIVAIHLLHTVPATQRRQLLVNMRNLLSPNGRLIVTMSARFTDIDPLPTERNLPVQFRSTGHTEMPGSTNLNVILTTGAVPVPAGGTRPDKHVTTTCQHAPNRFWDIARQQATEAATHAGFTVAAARNVGKGDQFGLPLGGQSLSQAALLNTDIFAIGKVANTLIQAGRYNCTARMVYRAYVLENPDNQHLSLSNNDYGFAMYLQQLVSRLAERVQANNSFLPANGVLHKAEESDQVSVMVVLRKA